MARCTFCSRDIEVGRGTIFVTLDGKVLHFCSRKCKKAFDLGRNKKKLGWIRKKKKTTSQ